VFAAALCLRAGFGLFQMLRAEDPAALTFPDEQQYWSMARDLRAGRPMTDELGFHATRTPLYPGLLALWAHTADSEVGRYAGADSGVIAARVMGWIIGAAAAALAALLGTRVVGTGGAVWAGLLVAADLPLVGLSSLLLSETPFVTACAALWYVGWPLQCRRAASGGYGRWLLVGVLSSLCVYARPSAAGLVVVWIAFLVIRRKFERRALAGAVLAGLAVVVSLIPWAERNRRLTGRWCWLTTRLGISLYDGVGPQADGAGDLGEIKQMSAVAGLDEAAWNDWFLRESFAEIRRDPVRILRLAGVKLARTWSPFLHAEEYGSRLVRAVFAVWSMVSFALAAAGLYLLRRRPADCVALLLPALYLSVMHSLFVGSVRYRVGATPMLAVLAAAALAALWGRFREIHAKGT